MKDSLIVSLEQAGLEVIPTNGKGDYHEFTHTIAWPACYKAASYTLGELEFDERYPTIITDFSIEIDSVEEDFYREWATKDLPHDLVYEITRHLAGGYWTMYGEKKALKAMVEKLDNRPREQSGYVTHLPEVKAILNELTERVPASVIHTNTRGPKSDISVNITIGFTLERDLL